MPHKFEAKNKNKLDSDWRRENLPPLPVLEQLGLNPADIFADIGCGIGYFTIPAAQFAASSSKVYALDTSAEMLAETQSRAAAAGVGNLVTVLTDEYDLKLPDETATFALLVQVLHEIDDKPLFIKEIKRLLTCGGKIAIVEWVKRPTEKGPPVDDRIGEVETARLLAEAGFEIVGTAEIAGTFYGLTAVKKA